MISMNFGDPSLPERFWRKVSPIPFPTYGMSGCWVWCGATTSRGYGSFNAGKRRDGSQITVPSHLATYRASGKPWPRKRRNVRIVVDHKCRLRACCNPDHLEAVHEIVNVLRGESPAAKHARRTHCPSGHEYTPENTYVWRRGNRSMRCCRACRRAA